MTRYGKRPSEVLGNDRHHSFGIKTIYLVRYCHEKNTYYMVGLSNVKRPHVHGVEVYFDGTKGHSSGPTKHFPEPWFTNRDGVKYLKVCSHHSRCRKESGFVQQREAFELKRAFEAKRRAGGLLKGKVKFVQ